MKKQAVHLILVTIVLLSPLAASAQSLVKARGTATATAARIQRADYEGDRAALQRLYEELTPLRSLTNDPRLASRVRYWQGFALWRKAINGFNEPAVPKDLEGDLQQAVREFEEALRQDTGFVDAKAGIISCTGYLLYLQREDTARVQELVPGLLQMLKDALAAAPENPRLLWVQGPSIWFARPGLSKSEVAERQALALATCTKKGLGWRGGNEGR